MKIATALAVVLSTFAFSAVHSDADAHGKKYGKKHSHYVRGVKPQVRGTIARGYAYQRPTSEGLYGSRTINNDQSFWERVNSDPRSNELGASGL